MKDYQTNELDAAIPLPASVTVAMADIAATMREGLLAMAVGAGLSVMQSLMDESVSEICGPKGKHQPDREAVRHGTEDGSVTPRRPASAGAPAPGAGRGWLRRDRRSGL
jgi:putative transposase